MIEILERLINGVKPYHNKNYSRNDCNKYLIILRKSRLISYKEYFIICEKYKIININENGLREQLKKIQKLSKL